MKRLCFLIVPLLLVLTAACATTTAQQKWDQGISVAANLNDAVIVSTNSLLTSRTITSPQAAKVAMLTSQVTTLLTTANAAWNAGNTAVANANLAKANATASSAQGCLSTKGAALDACLAPISGSTP